jgi:hypothetical protein
MNASKSIEDQPIPFAGGILDQHRHVCAFFNSPEEEQRILAPFVRDGLERGERAFHIVDPEQRDDYVRRLEDEGVAVAVAAARGQFEVRTWAETFFRTTRFDQHEMLALLDDTLKNTSTHGFPLTRLVGHVPWPLDDVVEYEARFNYIAVKYRDVVVCVHDASKISGGVAMDILRTHPMVLVGGLLHANPFYVPPDQFLRELHERAPRASDA